ncbi:hypothetical protein N7534_003359 [Penicillium rubens]|nr:hypothetical protein N7534_003359 [Penicillium rubens]
MSFSHKEPEVLPSGNTAPQVPQQDRTSQSLSQRVSQPENSESKDYAMNSGSVENKENAEKTMDQGRRGTAAIMEDHHKNSKKKGETSRAADESHSGDSTEAKGSRGKQGTMEKVKERLAHPLHGK